MITKLNASNTLKTQAAFRLPSTTNIQSIDNRTSSTLKFAGAREDSFFKEKRFTDWPDPHTKALKDLENSSSYKVTVKEWEKKGKNHPATFVGSVAVTAGLAWLGGWFGDHYNHGPEGDAGGASGGFAATYLVKPIVKEFFVPDAVQKKRALHSQSIRFRYKNSDCVVSNEKMKQNLKNDWFIWPGRQNHFTSFVQGFVSDYPIEQAQTRNTLTAVRGHHKTKDTLVPKMRSDFREFDPNYYNNKTWSDLETDIIDRNMFHQAIRRYARNVSEDHANLGVCFSEKLAVEAATKHLKEKSLDIARYLEGN